jgi:hypothetical protein
LIETFQLILTARLGASSLNRQDVFARCRLPHQKSRILRFHGRTSGSALWCFCYARAFAGQEKPVTAIDIALEPDATMIEYATADNACLLEVSEWFRY